MPSKVKAQSGKIGVEAVKIEAPSKVRSKVGVRASIWSNDWVKRTKRYGVDSVTWIRSSDVLPGQTRKACWEHRRAQSGAPNNRQVSFPDQRSRLVLARKSCPPPSSQNLYEGRIPLSLHKMEITVAPVSPCLSQVFPCSSSGLAAVSQRARQVEDNPPTREGGGAFISRGWPVSPQGSRKLPFDRLVGGFGRWRPLTFDLPAAAVHSAAYLLSLRRTASSPPPDKDVNSHSPHPTRM